MGMRWEPPPLPPQQYSPPRPTTRARWLPAAIIGAAIVIAAGLVAGAVILKGKEGGSAGAGPTTCQAWTQTRQTLRAVPSLPQVWNWDTPNIDTYISNQNAPVGKALDLFEPQIAADPADVARAAQRYVDARRRQIQTLTDHTYVPADGVAVDSALVRLNQLCGITDIGQPL